MATWLKQSTAAEIKVGPFVDSVDGVTAETGLTITQSEVLLAKGAGDFAQKNESTSLVHESNGWYRCLLDTTDTNTTGPMVLQIAESGALPVWNEFLVLPANVYDALVTGSDLLDINAAEWNSLATVALPLVPTTAGRTLDVSAGGEAGVDWANVGSPTTVVGLSGTTVKTATDVEADTQDIQSTLGTPTDTSVSADIFNLNVLTTALVSSFGTLFDALVVAQGTTGTVGNDTTHLHLSTLGFGDDELNDLIVVIHDQSEDKDYVRWIEDWDGTSKLITVATLPFTPQNSTDPYTIIAIRRDVKVASIAANAIDATAIANDAITDAKVASDVTIAAVTGAVGSVTGNVGGNVTGSIGSLAAQAKADVNAEADAALTDYDAPTRAEATADKDAILTAVDALPTAAENADGILGRNIAGGSDGGRDVTSALRVLRNKVTVDATAITVTEEDDSTTAWTGAVTRVQRDALETVDPA